MLGGYTAVATDVMHVLMTIYLAFTYVLYTFAHETILHKNTFS